MKNIKILLILTTAFISAFIITGCSTPISETIDKAKEIHEEVKEIPEESFKNIQ